MWRISVAICSMVAPTDAQAQRYSAWRSRATTWVAGTGTRPRAEHTWASTRGSMLENVPTAPDSLPTATRWRAARRRCTVAVGLEGPQCELGAEGGGLGVHPVGAPGHRDVDRLEGPGLAGTDQFGGRLDQQVGGPGQGGTQRRVDHVGRRQPVVDPRPLGLADGLLDDVHEGGHVVVGHPLALGHRLDEGGVDLGGVVPAELGGVARARRRPRPIRRWPGARPAATWRTGPRRRRVRPSPSARSGGSSGGLCFHGRYGGTRRRARRAMSVRCCMPGHLMAATPAYARARASSRVPPRAVTPSTRPPAVDDAVRPGRAGAGVEDGDPGQGAGLGQAGDAVAGAGRLGVALGGQHHAHGRFGAEPGRVTRAPGGHLGQQGGQVTFDAGQDDLGLRIAEADVELEDLRARRGQHQPGVEHAAVVDAPGPQGGHQRSHGPGHQ